MTVNDPNDQAKANEISESVPADTAAASEAAPAENGPAAENSDNGAGAETESTSQPRRILIGSQRDPGAYRPKRPRDWKPIEETQKPKKKRRKPSPAPPAAETPPAETPPAETPQAETQPAETPQVDTPAAVQEASPEPPPKPAQPKPAEPKPQSPKPAVADVSLSEAVERELAEMPDGEMPGEGVGDASPAQSGGRVPVPRTRDKLSADLEGEFEAAISGVSLDELMSASDELTSSELLEPESKHTGRVVAIQRGDAFVQLGGREQGCISLELFEEPPALESEIEVVVQRFNSDDGLYDLTLPNRAIEVDHWADVHEGMLLEARVTGHNTGGLECEVNHLRGFIPVSQVAIYRVEDLAQFVDEKFTCLVTEVNAERRNLVLSRRAVLEREKEEAREALLASLAPGQVHEGVVRKLVDFGAFVDLGGVDGLLHISQLSWSRVEHPRDVLSEGQSIRVKVEKVDAESGKISLAYRDMLESPWTNAEKKFPEQTIVEGTVSKLMEFGAFVELEPGVEGLVHISELSHKRVWRAQDVVHEGEKIQVMVLSVDSDAQRIGLSIKQVHGEPEPAKKDEDKPESDALPKKSSKRQARNQPLQGGIGKATGGEKFGLKW